MTSKKTTKKTAGRPKGRKNDATLARERAARRALNNGQTPLEFFLETMRNENNEYEQRFEAAKAAAPYVHARTQAVQLETKKAKSIGEVSNDELVAIAAAKKGKRATAH